MINSPWIRLVKNIYHHPQAKLARDHKDHREKH